MVLSDVTMLHLTQYSNRFPQSALLTGPVGIGFEGAIEWLAHALNLKPYRVWPEKEGKIDIQNGQLTVERIRSLYEVTKSRSATPRLVIVDEADRMSAAAQNAFLKMLEEPGPSVHFLLMSHIPGSLLPTIRSRVTTVRMTPIDTTQTLQLLDQLDVKDETKRQQLIFIAGGLPALLTNLARDDSLFEHRAQIVRDARAFIQGKTYEKLRIANTYKERRDALLMLEDAAKLLSRNFSSSSASRIATYLDSYEHIEANGNIKLWLARTIF